MLRYYHRLLSLDNKVIAKLVFNWDRNLNSDHRIKSWSSEVENIFSEVELSEVYESGTVFNLREVVEHSSKILLLKQQRSIERDCFNSPKLRTFVKFKDFHSTPSYIINPCHLFRENF